MKTMPSSSHSDSDPVVSVTTDREAHSERWVAALAFIIPTN